MIKVKHFMDAIEGDDNERLWVEPLKLTRDLRQWCGVTGVLPQIGPPRDVWEWFQENPDGYEFFRAVYHEHLTHSAQLRGLRQLACISERVNITLLHQSSDPERNTAAALYEFLSELRVYGMPE